MSQLEHNTKHEPAMKAVRVNGKITEVKQSSLVNNKMADHLGSIHFEFFSGSNIRQIRQICQIVLISLNYGKTQFLNFSGSMVQLFELNGLLLLHHNRIQNFTQTFTQSPHSFLCGSFSSKNIRMNNTRSNRNRMAHSFISSRNFRESLNIFVMGFWNILNLWIGTNTQDIVLRWTT